jgi:hypothetical protein
MAWDRQAERRFHLASSLAATCRVYGSPPRSLTKFDLTALMEEGQG